MAADPLVGKTLADRFEILERIGEGGTGVVYKARQTSVDRDVAIKVLGAHVSQDPQWVKRFQNEAKAVAKLHHPNTVQLVDFGQTREGLLFIAMELLHGRSLRDEIDKVGRLPPNRALRIISQACGSVGEAHSLGIIHRDLKPDNLYLVEMKGAGDSVKVLDFSVAKMEDGGGQQTRAGIVFGTPAYMSPEQGKGAKLGPQSDIYAFGIVLYEMLTGKPPFDSRIPTEVVMMHLRDQPKPLSGFPEPLNALVMRTLDKEPSRRQQSCEELAAECESVLAQLYPQMTPSGMRAQSTGGHAPIASPPVQGQRPGGSAPPPAASGMSSSSGGGGARQPVEQRTMIAEAPNVSYSPPPPSGGYGAPPAGGRGAPPPGGGGYGAPPPSAGGYGQRPPAGGGGQSTMIADAPSLPPRGGPNSTMISDGGARPSLGGGGGAPGGTMILPDSQGVIAFELAKAEAARQAAVAEPVAAKPAHWTFWAAWVVLGVGAGIVLHLVRIHG